MDAFFFAADDGEIAGADQLGEPTIKRDQPQVWTGESRDVGILLSNCSSSSLQTAPLQFIGFKDYHEQAHLMKLIDKQVQELSHYAEETS